MSNSWYVIYTRPYFENKIAILLNRRNIEAYCPLIEVLQNTKSGKKIILEPLFKSYVFVRIDSIENFAFRKIGGVRNLLYWLDKPARIYAEEIMVIKLFLSCLKNIRLEKSAVCKVHRLDLSLESLSIYEKIYSKINYKTVKVLLPSLGFTVIGDIEKTLKPETNEQNRLHFSSQYLTTSLNDNSGANN